MKGFFDWFKGSTKIKRWIVLILIGMSVLCYGISKMLVLKEMEVFEVLKIAVIFIVGFIGIILGIVFIQKRTLELMVEANDEEDDEIKQKAQVDIQSLIFNRKIYESGPKVVVIGGGEGTDTLIKGIKKYTQNITAIVTISDYGKEASLSRKELNVLPFDDVKSSISALSYNEEMMEYLMNYKLKNEKLKDLTFGDIYLESMNEVFNDITDSISNSSNVLNIVGKVLPVTADPITICAELNDGTVVTEKNNIAKVAYEKVAKINRVYITPSNSVPAPGVLEAIKEADAIIIGPGSLYTNVIPNLLIKNVSKAIRESKAFKVYVSNLMTEPGQTDNFSISDHLKAINEHAGGKIVDYCICDTGEIVPEVIRKYNMQGYDLVDIDLPKLSEMGVNIIHKKLSVIENGKIRHDADTVAVSIMELICTDLKFKDKQYDTQYVLLNSKLKKQKKDEKVKVKKHKEVKKKNTQNKSKHIKLKSKFAEKYKDRIEDIKASDVTRVENRAIFEETGSLYKEEKENKKRESKAKTK